MNLLDDRLKELKLGLERNDPATCGRAPAWLVVTVLRNLDKAIGGDATCEQVGNEHVKSFAMGAIKFIADQGAPDCEIILEQLNELLTMAN